MSQNTSAKIEKEKVTKASQPGRRSINKSGVKSDQPSVQSSNIFKETLDEVADDSMWKPLVLKNGDIPQHRPVMKGGWSDSSRASTRALDDPDDDRRLHLTAAQQEPEVDSDPEIPMIPDLEEAQVMTARGDEHVVHAPLVAVNRVTTYKELDNELTKHVAFLTLDNEIDLKLLSRGLCTEEELKEDDVAWEWDQLFTEVSSELTTEWQKLEQAEDKFSAMLLT